MNEFLTKLVEQVKNIYSKLNQTQKFVALGIIVGIALAVIMLFTFTGRPAKVQLFKTNLNSKDYGEIAKKLQDWGKYEYELYDNKIYVSVKDREYIKTDLYAEGIVPQDKPGWELFDMQKWTTTDFERDVNKRRAIIGSIENHIKRIRDIENVSIALDMPEPELYTDSERPYQASVIITPAPYSDITENKKKIKNIVDLIAKGIDKLKSENIVISDNMGNPLTELVKEEGDIDYIERAKQEFKEQERQRKALMDEIRAKLKNVIGEKEVDLTVRLALDFSQKHSSKKVFLPFQLKADNPETPYDESEVLPHALRSKQNVKENFKGHGFVPEGAPGVESTLPPGYPEYDPKHAEYQKTDNVENYELGEQNTEMDDPSYTVKRISVSAWLDGEWKKVKKKGKDVWEDNVIKRDYTPRSEENIKDIEALIKGAINYNKVRGDMVVVKNIPFNWKERWIKEDSIYLRRTAARKMLLFSFGILLLLFLVTLVYRAVMKEIARRRRIREEELAHQQQMMREAALRAAEEEGVDIQLSLEEKARLEMQENAINLARERPEDVANLLRTWMAEE